MPLIYFNFFFSSLFVITSMLFLDLIKFSYLFPSQIIQMDENVIYAIKNRLFFFVNKNVFRSTYPWCPQKWKWRPPQPQKWWLTSNNELKCRWKWPHYHPRDWSHHYCPPPRCQPKGRPRPLPPRSLNVFILFSRDFSCDVDFTRFSLNFFGCTLHICKIITELVLFLTLNNNVSKMKKNWVDCSIREAINGDWDEFL